MKVYGLPEELPAPEMNVVGDGDFMARMEKHRAAETAHEKDLAEWLRANGYAGKNTGRTYSTPMADGYANYMLAEPTRGSGGRSFLVHLPYGDAWHDPHVEHLPKSVILDGIERQEKLTAIFAGKE